MVTQGRFFDSKSGNPDLRKTLGIFFDWKSGKPAKITNNFVKIKLNFEKRKELYIHL